MGERVVNGNFAEHETGWTCTDLTTECCNVQFWDEEDETFLVLEACLDGCIVGFYQDVDLTNVPTLNATLLWYLTDFDPGNNYLRIYIDSTKVWDASSNPDDFTLISVDTSAYSGVHRISFVMAGTWDYYAFAEFKLISAIGSDLPPAPIAAFTGTPTSGGAPLMVAFTDLSTGSPTSWLWSFGDGNLSAEQNPTHVYGFPGSYTVNLKATNAGGFDTEQKDNYIVVTVPDPEAVLLWKFQFGPS
jgi:PKD repeat protein